MEVTTYGTRLSAKCLGKGTVITLLLALCFGVQACATRTWSSGSGMDRGSARSQLGTKPGAGWSRLQAVAGGTELEIQVHGGAASPDAQVIKGRFRKATADTIVVAGLGGSEHILERESVVVVRAKRPFWSRTPGWIAFGVLAGIMMAIFPAGGDLSFPIIWVYAAFPASVPFFLASAMEIIYRAPTDVRSNRVGTQE